MNINQAMLSNLYRTVKAEPEHDGIDRFKGDLLQQKEDYERQIRTMQKAHEEQICKLCDELEKSATSLHQYRAELDSMRLALKSKEQQATNGTSSEQRSPSDSSGLAEENSKLKDDLSALTTKYQSLTNEMHDAREYILKMIASLD